MRKNVLIADDDQDVVELLTRRCEAMGLLVDSANNAMSTLGKAEECRPDLVILDVDMPYGDGLSVCEMMAGHEELKRIPVIIMTGDRRPATVQRCHELCAYYVLKSPDLWSRLRPLVSDLLGVEKSTSAVHPPEISLPPIQVGRREPARAGGGEPRSLVDAVFEILDDGVGAPCYDNKPQSEEPDDHQPWVLSIEDDNDVAFALEVRLKELGLNVLRAEAGRDGYRRAFFETPSAIILDYELPQGNGDYVLRRLKESPATSSIPVIVLTGRRDPHIEHQMRRLGADEFLTKPFEWKKLRDALLRLQTHHPAPSELVLA